MEFLQRLKLQLFTDVIADKCSTARILHIVIILVLLVFYSHTEINILAYDCQPRETKQMQIIHNNFVNDRVDRGWLYKTF